MKSIKTTFQERKFRIIMKIQEMFTKDLEELKNKQTRMRNTRKIQ